MKTPEVDDGQGEGGKDQQHSLFPKDDRREQLWSAGWKLTRYRVGDQAAWRDPETQALVPESDALERLRRRQIVEQDRDE